MKTAVGQNLLSLAQEELSFKMTNECIDCQTNSIVMKKVLDSLLH